MGSHIRLHDHHQSTYSAVIHFTKGSTLMFPNAHVEVDPIPGQIVLFDALEAHFVPPHDSDIPRISMAMNITKKEQ